MKSASARTSVSIEVYDTRKGDMKLAAIFFGKTQGEAKARAQEYAEFKAQESNAKRAKELLGLFGSFIIMSSLFHAIGGLSMGTLAWMLVWRAAYLAVIWWKGRKS